MRVASYITGVLCLLGLLGYVYVVKSKELTNLQKKHEQENLRHEQSIKELRERLEVSNNVRDSAIYRISHLDSIIKDLISADSLIEAEKNGVKGSFDNKTSSELEKEMIKQYQQQ